MIFITGPLYSGKKTVACRLLGCAEEQLGRYAAWEVQDALTGRETPAELAEMADRLARLPVVIATEVGGGVVPMEAEQRAKREAAGRLSCLLAERAETVVRVFCGLPEILKGTLQ